MATEMNYPHKETEIKHSSEKSVYEPTRTNDSSVFSQPDLEAELNQTRAELAKAHTLIARYRAVVAILVAERNPTPAGNLAMNTLRMPVFGKKFQQQLSKIVETGVDEVLKEHSARN
jgi:hypothetical protein